MQIERTTSPDCPECESPVRFELFGESAPQGLSVDLHTILVCLSLAEKAGHIPPLPDQWWIETKGHLSLNLPSLDAIQTEEPTLECIQYEKPYRIL